MSESLPSYRDYEPDPAESTETPWRRLHSRVIWVDVAQTLLSLTPAVLALLVFGTEPSAGTLWPVVAIGVFGTLGAVTDGVRWFFTRYRVTGSYVERRTGVFVRQYRSVRRDRIRSVDATAKLRHRLAGLRVINIGAGQQSSAGESALVLDAILKADAEELRQDLLWARPNGTRGRDGTGQAEAVPAGVLAEARTEPAVDVATDDVDERVFARLRPSWVVYNMFNVWAYIMAIGLLWGGFWLASTFGIDVEGFIDGLADWDELGWGWSIAIGLAVTGAIGVIGLAVNFFTENWNFQLARVAGEHGTQLRTRKGLFTTREVNRDDNRMRGLQISEPLLWRWMGMADTNVVTTGLSLWSSSQPATILPRGPIAVARSVAADVLDVRPSPLDAPLERHPRAALHRRMWWATAITAIAVGVLAWLAATGVVPGWTVWLGATSWPLTLLGALVAYRALGHAVVGSYVVVRSGLMSRSTVALQRKAVSTIALRESVLQRRLGLKTVSAMTAAGWGAYEASDMEGDAAVEFAAAAAPGLLEPFLLREPVHTVR
ncbi:PH domain-containing protein [Phytoactinopolyspora endophytica]|uniref:PH domain-containing protein n=1 Tax=Phytoactinopolyspora endophytica TaxID=1642495 RepID=UPI00101D1939|nr:PH domain-containing protein [Phytoactinopolyspora endophytica]